MAKNINCLLVNFTGLQPFNRCKYCQRHIQQCFGLQFFVISAAIISLIIVALFVSDIPALAIDIMIVIILLVALLSFLASQEINEIIINRAMLENLNKELEERVKQRTQELQRANDDLKKLNEMENEFIGIINHELKSPITSVLSGIEVIRARGTEKFDSSQKKLLDIMWISGLDMLRLANNLLDVSKIDSGKFIVYPERIPIINMVEEVLQALKPEIDRKKLKITSKIDDSISTIYADSVRLKQVAFNLIDNAVKYSKDGGKVSIIAKDLGKQISIEVSDSGVGIKPENISQIFNKFAKRQPGFKGTGLGLYISKSFVEAHGGKIEVESKYEKGSTFRFIIPKIKP